MNSVQRKLAESRGRQHLDKRGRDGRRSILGTVLGGGHERLQLAASAARNLHRYTGGLKTVNWQATSPAPDLFDGDALSFDYFTDGASMEKFWYRHADESHPTHGSSSSEPFIPIARNPYGGLEWNLQLFVNFGYGPFPSTDLPSDPYSQLSTTTIELLDKAGGVIKSCVGETFRFNHINFGDPEQNQFNQSESPRVYDANGPIEEFWGIKATFEFTDDPDTGGNEHSLIWLETRV